VHLFEIVLAMKILRPLLVIFAIIGLASTSYWTYQWALLPPAFASPSNFLILRIDSAANQFPARTRLTMHLAGVRNLNQLKTEGNLVITPAKLSHFHLDVPLDGAVVNGEGTIEFEHTRIEINSDEILINGYPVVPKEIRVSRFGKFQRGPIRIAK
jgi:hypothetical protein